MNEEALAHATMAFNTQLAAVRAENAKLFSKVEKGEIEKDKLQTEVQYSLFHCIGSEMAFLCVFTQLSDETFNVIRSV